MSPVLVINGHTTTWLTLDTGTNTIYLPSDFCGNDGVLVGLIAIPLFVLLYGLKYLNQLHYTTAAAERLHSYLLLSFEHAVELARTCANTVVQLPEVKGDDSRVDDIEATIQALAQMLERQMAELLSWMDIFSWERLGERRRLSPICNALVELKKKIEANERVKDDLRAVQQRIIAMQSSHDLKEILQRKQLDRTLETVYARLDAAKNSERAPSDSVIRADGLYNSTGSDVSKDVLQSIKSARVRA